MADFISFALDASANANLVLSGYIAGQSDPKLYLSVGAPSPITIQPTEKISTLIVPVDDVMTSGDASGYLSNPASVGNPARGIYLYRYTNTTGEQVSINTLHNFTIGGTHLENIMYRLYWLQEYDGSVLFAQYSGTPYSFPHNIQPQELAIQTELIDNNTTMRYLLSVPALNNSGSANYGTLGIKPYSINVSYSTGWDWVSGVFESSNVVFSNDISTRYLDYYDFDANFPDIGVYLTLPFYDSRITTSEVPAQYIIRIKYNSADNIATGKSSVPLPISVNHQQWETKEFLDLDTWGSTHFNPARLQKIEGDDVFIEKGIIDRRRLSIGIKDISVSQNNYVKKGTYVSKYYTLDAPIYTFSLKVNEFIPEYENINKYDIVKYFIQFNNKDWVQVSPISRNNEVDANNVSVPKLLVFDSNTSKNTDSVLFLNYQVPVLSFRIKIDFDMTAIGDNLFIPPEIRDYDCIIFDKNQLVEI